jgi:H+/Cl- antiporter ClcA
VGNGNQTLKSLIRLGADLPLDLLMSTAFARMFTLGVSMNCGFVGGFIFPIFTIGLIVGVMAHNQYPDVPLGLTVCCFLAGVPSGICPMPFTMLCLTCFIFFLGLTQTVPVFISCIVAYTVFTGLGIFGALTSRAGNNAKKDSLERDSEVGKRSDLDEPVGKYNAKPPRGSFQYHQVPNEG